MIWFIDKYGVVVLRLFFRFLIKSKSVRPFHQSLTLSQQRHTLSHSLKWFGLYDHAHYTFSRLSCVYVDILAEKLIYIFCIILFFLLFYFIAHCHCVLCTLVYMSASSIITSVVSLCVRVCLTYLIYEIIFHTFHFNFNFNCSGMKVKIVSELCHPTLSLNLPYTIFYSLIPIFIKQKSFYVKALNIKLT